MNLFQHLLVCSSPCGWLLGRQRCSCLPESREYISVWNLIDWVSIILAFTLLGASEPAQSTGRDRRRKGGRGETRRTDSPSATEGDQINEDADMLIRTPRDMDNLRISEMYTHIYITSSYGGCYHDLSIKSLHCTSFVHICP